MKVDGPGIGPAGARGAGRSGATAPGKAKGKSPLDFFGLLKEVMPSQAAVTATETGSGVSQWMLDLEDAGSRMEREGSMAAFEQYKQVVKRILAWAEKRAFDIELQTVRDRMVKGQVVNKGPRHILRVVDTELESLLALVQRQEKDRLAVADRVVRIRGLLLDVLR